MDCCSVASRVFLIFSLIPSKIYIKQLGEFIYRSGLSCLKYCDGTQLLIVSHLLLFLSDNLIATVMCTLATCDVHGSALEDSPKITVGTECCSQNSENSGL